MTGINDARRRREIRRRVTLRHEALLPG